MKTNLDIVLIDDDPQIDQMLNDYFAEAAPTVTISWYHSGEEALSKMVKMPTAVILDYHLQTENAAAMSSLQVLHKLKEKFKGIRVIFLSSEDKPTITMNITKYGAYDYVVKNVQAFQRLAIILNHIVIQQQFEQKLRRLTLWFLLLAAVTAIVVIKVFLGQ